MSVTTLSESLPRFCLSPWGTLVAADLNSALLKFRTSGVFTVSLRVEALDAASMLEAIEGRMEHISLESNTLAVSCPYEPQEDGSYVFRFSKPARSTDGEGRTVRYKPRLDDAKSRKLPKFHRVPLGSLVRVSFGFNHEYRPETAGVSLEFLGLQTAETK